MTATLNETHDPTRRSFVETANAPDSDFPIQNLPFGVFRAGPGTPPRVGVAIGDQILDVAAAVAWWGPVAAAAEACASPSLNARMAPRAAAWSALRLALSKSLSADRGDKSLAQHLMPMAKAELVLPVAIGDFTDFYAGLSRHQYRAPVPAGNPLLPNYKYVPVAYHGRASSVRVAARRCDAQRASASRQTKRCRASVRSAIWISSLSSASGSAPQRARRRRFLSREAAEHIFGFCLLNDWSARDIQAWEYQPLGPFLARISPPRSRPGW